MRNKKFMRKSLWLIPLAAAAFLMGSRCDIDIDDKGIVQAAPSDGIQIAQLPLFTLPSA